MKLDRERFLAAAMMLGAATSTAACKSSPDKAQIGKESAEGPAAEGIGSPSLEGNAGVLRPSSERGVLVPNREGFAPPGFNPAREGTLIAPTKEGTVVAPTKEGSVVVPGAVNPPGWAPVDPNAAQQPPAQPAQPAQPAGRPPVLIPKLKGR
jgi:hypothetical protein